MNDGTAERGGQSRKGSPYRTILQNILPLCYHTPSPPLRSAPVSAVRTLGENGPMFSGTRASSERRKLPDVRRVCRLIGGGGNRRPSHRKETLLVFVTQTTKDQAPDVALCPVIVSSNVGIPV